ncbi:Haloacid dehalogenase-like hydrolase domain-containing protein 3 [Morella rubra]|uniref:Haloacid dehalogenase-like hydrolase domain-containing protein 3 n=1 Tax=Morella rubra TaxID=262757 RepID=A0A6A1W8I6_9ROSI|nr:Haloacid dehalogenase-like hydrolase domain-containing protein 3 [Morella rubra]
MSILSRLRCITVDVTGTLIAYKGELGDYYCMEAKSEGFKLAYKDMAKKYPCFGFATKMPNVVWWKTCAGYDYDEETFEKVFRRIYASFRSSTPYTVFPDSQPFLRWLREERLKVGIISNAESRYKDVILPALNLNPLTLQKFNYPMKAISKEGQEVAERLKEKAEEGFPSFNEMNIERHGCISRENVVRLYQEKLPDDFPDYWDWRIHGVLNPNGIRKEEEYPFKGEKSNCIPKTEVQKSTSLKISGIIEVDFEDEAKLLEQVKQQPIPGCVTVYKEFIHLKEGIYEGPKNLESERKAGYDYDEETFEKVFRRIYASFGSSAPTVLPDSKPFLRWLRERLKVGIISNAEYRYKDVILPALNLNQVEKPDPRIYEIALENWNIAPE